jgi:hypothetical protein
VDCSLVKKMRKMLEMNWEVKIIHLYKETNKYAEALTNIGCDFDHTIFFYDNCPNPMQIKNLFLADVLVI